MEEYRAKEAAGERGATRILLFIWVAEMLWVSFFGMKRAATEANCNSSGYGAVVMVFSLNYVVPLWFLLVAFWWLVVGQVAKAKEALTGGIKRTVDWYRAAPTMTFIAFALLAWTAYNVSFRYHVSLDYRDPYSDDLDKIRAVTDTLTGITTKITIPGQECADSEDD